MALMDEIPRWQYRIVYSGSFSTGTQLGMGARHRCDKASNWMHGLDHGLILLREPIRPGEEPDGAGSEVWNLDHVTAAYRSVTT